MSLRNLNLGTSFEEILSMFPNSVSNYSINHLNNGTLNEEKDSNITTDQDETSETLNNIDNMSNKNAENSSKNNAYNLARAKEKLKIDLKSGSTMLNCQNSSSDQTAFITAIYNTIAMGTLIISFAALILLYYVLQAFIRPIIWAILTSAFLFSFKRYLADLSRKKLEQVEKNNTTLAMEIALLPISTLDALADNVWTFIRSKYRHLLALIGTIIIFHLSSSFSQTLVYLVRLGFTYTSNFTNLMAYNYFIDYYSTWQFTFTLLVAYLLAIVFYWNESYTTFFQIISLPIWLSIFLLCSKMMGSYRPLFMFGFLCLAMIGFYSIIFEFVIKHKSTFRVRRSTSRNNKSFPTGNSIAEEEPVSAESIFKETDEFEEEDNEEFEDTHELIDGGEEEATDLKNMSISSADSQHVSPNNSFLKTTMLNIYQTSIYYFNTSLNNSRAKANRHHESGRRKKENSDKFFILLFWLFLCVKLRYDFYIIIPLLVIIWKLLRHFVLFLLSMFINNQKVKFYFGILKEWAVSRSDVLAPKPFQIMFKLFIKGDRKINQVLQKSMDNMITALMIICLLFALLTITIILVIKVQSESVQLITILSNILNENLYSKPELREWLPERERLSKIYLLSIKNFYLYGREWIVKSLKSSTFFESSQGQVNNNSDFLILEAQILEQWDSLYAYLSKQASNSFNASNSLLNKTVNNLGQVILLPSSQNLSSIVISAPFNATIENAIIGRNISSILDTISFTKKNLADLFKYKHLAIIIKDNLGILMSVMDSLYTIVRGNFTLLTTIIYTVISTIFSSGFALMNFFFSFIVYMTALFYLLSMSGSRFKPLQLLTEINFFKNGGQAQNNRISRGALVSRAIEDSIRSVFVASLKMAAFFGFYTYSINCLFSVNIIYLPAIISALFAVLPLIGTYWFCIPGLLELWLIYDSPVMAILFVIMHLLPYILSVDRSIYSEIKGGHPYLTGLAFAGGVYCLGLEGAIIGPIILCLFIVIGKIITNTSMSTTSSNNCNISMRNSVSVAGFSQILKTPSLEKQTN